MFASIMSVPVARQKSKQLGVHHQPKTSYTYCDIHPSQIILPDRAAQHSLHLPFPLDL